MKPDPIIDRIRQTRHELSAQFGHDPRRMLKYYLELQKNTPPERFYRPKKPEAPELVNSNSGKTAE